MVIYACFQKTQKPTVLKVDVMKLIKRDGYLNKLANLRGTPDIKIISGVRRAGKSKLLEAFRNMLLSQKGVNVIDFVAMRGSEKTYIQVSDNVADPLTFEREMTPFAMLRDGYPRMLIARTRNPETDYEGVRIVNLSDWLLHD